MTRLSFVATEASFEADEYALVCGVTGEGRYLAFQRDAEGSGEDWGVHLEYGDQANGGYDCVARCRLAGNAMTIYLARPLGRLTGVTGFDVTLDVGPESLASLRTGLPRVFRGDTDTLHVE